MKIRDLKHGQSCTCVIDETWVDDARISINGLKVFICQNVIRGVMATDQLGYEYGWMIGHVDDGDLEEVIASWGVTDFKLVEDEKPTTTAGLDFIRGNISAATTPLKTSVFDLGMGNRLEITKPKIKIINKYTKTENSLSDSEIIALRDVLNRLFS